MAASVCIISNARGKVLPSEKISIGVVGLGSRGFNLIDEILSKPNARISAICDVDSLHYRDRPWEKGKPYGRNAAKEHIEKKQGSGGGLTVSSDFREICGRDDIDAVVVATPDHWHALCTLEAIRHGKDVYCEKPVTHTFREGQLVYRAAREKKIVFQTGSQQRSDSLFHRAVELVRNGLLGNLESVEVGLPPGYDKPQGDTSIVAPPKSLDYDFWCGPAPKLPYMRARHHRWWRGHRAFGGGVLMDWIGHHNDIAHWALNLDKSGPTRIETVEWTHGNNEVYDTPHQYAIHCEYESGIKSSISSKHKTGTKIIGDAGWVFVARGKLLASDNRWTRKDFDPGNKVQASANHMADFLNCIGSRRPCIAPAETAHRSITPGHIAFVSQQLGRAINWDPKKEIAINDAEANRLLQSNQYRQPWGVSQ